MIFVTVGTQLPFERLIKAVDEWAEKWPEIYIFAQVGDTEYIPQHMTFVRKLTPQEYSQKFNDAQVVVSHAGMGTIISALENGKYLVLVPRLAALGEHRNDHQLGTAEKFAHYQQIRIAKSTTELHDALSNSVHGVMVSGSNCPPASVSLLERLKSFIDEA
ncbi:MAG: glucuronosyltransferase [Gammaproteobacteria bacterium]|nr:glucuronosyltransferase [Gammaproteobacteria bacterium]